MCKIGLKRCCRGKTTTKLYKWANNGAGKHVEDLGWRSQFP
jgi:hypothetical protein